MLSWTSLNDSSVLALEYDDVDDNDDSDDSEDDRSSVGGRFCSYSIFDDGTAIDDDNVDDDPNDDSIDVH